jgi:hypothetical protein
MTYILRKTKNKPNLTSNRFCVKFVFFHYVFMEIFDKGTIVIEAHYSRLLCGRVACMMAKLRPNSFVIDLNNIAKKPVSELVHDFIFEKLKIDHDEVASLQISYSKKMVFVETQTLEESIEIVRQNNLKQTMKVDNVEYVVKMYVVDGGVDVKIFDLPPNMPNGEIVEKLSEYGEVLSIIDEVWGESFKYKNIKSGVRLARMKLNKNIPSYIEVNGEQTYVLHANQIQTCKWCCARLHHGISCAENRQIGGTSVSARLSFCRCIENE